MSKLTAFPTAIAGVMRIKRNLMTDERGAFARLFCADELASVGWTEPVAQINHSVTERVGSVRGMHYQRPPKSEIKLVSCIRGKVFDVVIDIRKSSTTFMQHVAVELDAKSGDALLLPKGVAHGFQVLEEHSELIYCHSCEYVPDHEEGINPLDPLLNICWPLPIADISEKDVNRAMLTEDYCGVTG